MVTVGILCVPAKSIENEAEPLVRFAVDPEILSFAPKPKFNQEPLEAAIAVPR